jgi:hypothetical protein
MSFCTLKESYNQGTFTNQYHYDKYTTSYDQKPLSDTTYIPSNVAGFVPYSSKIITKKPEEKQQEYNYYYSNSTFTPLRVKSPDYLPKTVVQQP